MSFQRNTLQKTPRKVKWCFWCGQKCLPNEPRIESAWIFEGDFQSGHYHVECKEAEKQWWLEHYGESEGPNPREMQRGKTVYQDKYEDS